MGCRREASRWAAVCCRMRRGAATLRMPGATGGRRVMVIQLNARDYTLCRDCDIWYNSEKYGECPLCMAYEGIERVLEKQFDVTDNFDRFKTEITVACQHAEAEEPDGMARYDRLRDDVKKALRKLKGASVTRL